MLKIWNLETESRGTNHTIILYFKKKERKIQKAPIHCKVTIHVFYLSDFDGVLFHISNPGDDKTKVMVSIWKSNALIARPMLCIKDKEPP